MQTLVTCTLVLRRQEGSFERRTDKLKISGGMAVKIPKRTMINKYGKYRNLRPTDTKHYD